ncbi:MAG: hypothetical protein LBP87_00115 [Planctomycetaceae bacterium]|jgi:hypothetical protein|nr:hypothetical protein [Planctomycetaceae bacterium]
MKRFLFLILIIFVFIGCGQRVHEIEGNITLDDKPLVSGYIVFFGNSGKGVEGGARIVDGKYVGKAASGMNLVKVQGFFKNDKPIPDPDFPGSFITTQKATKDELHWNNPNLIIDLSPGINDIHLKSLKQ